MSFRNRNNYQGDFTNSERDRILTILQNQSIELLNKHNQIRNDINFIKTQIDNLEDNYVHACEPKVNSTLQ